jgi:hypothetical protein
MHAIHTCYCEVNHTLLPFSHVTAWIGKPAAGHVTANGSPATAEIGGILRIIGSPEGKSSNKWHLSEEARKILYRTSHHDMARLRECILWAI